MLPTAPLMRVADRGDEAVLGTFEIPDGKEKGEVRAAEVGRGAWLFDTEFQVLLPLK